MYKQTTTTTNNKQTIGIVTIVFLLSIGLANRKFNNWKIMRVGKKKKRRKMPEYFNAPKPIFTNSALWAELV